MFFHKTIFRNIGSSQYAYDAKYEGNRRFRLRVPAYETVESLVPEEIYPLLIADAGQPKYSHIQVIEPEPVTAAAPVPAPVPVDSGADTDTATPDPDADPAGRTAKKGKNK